MRLHFLVAAGVLVAALSFDVSRLELVVLLLAIAFVLIAEMVNTAIEAAVDVASTAFDPMAKLAKDIAAGAVLIAAINAVAVGYLVFSGQVGERSSQFLDRLSDAPAELTLIALVLTILVVITTKAFTGRGTPLRGGLPSRARRCRIRRLDGGDSGPRRLAAALPRLVRDVHHGLVGRPDPRRVRHPLGPRSALRGLLGALVTLGLFQVFSA